MDEPLAELDVEFQIKDLFTGGRAVYAPEGGGWELDGAVEHVIDGWLTRFVLRAPHGEEPPREVSLFHGVDDLAGELWDHEVRNLLRLRMLGHPALPEIVDGRFDKTNRVAFIMTRKVGGPLAEQDWGDVREWVGRYPVVAFEQFSLLVDALSQLHGTRIVHRNLTLGAIRLAMEPSRPERAALALTRFELSALLKNLLHHVAGPDDHRSQDVRELFLAPPTDVPPSRHLAYLAPETHPSLLGKVRVRRLDHGSTDVFGLGVLGWELFLGAVTELLPEECAAVEQAPEERLPEALAALHTAMRRALTTTTGVPRRLREVLVDMLDPSPSGRISSFDAAATLQRHWTEITLSFAPVEQHDEKPRLLAFMPEKSVQTVYENRGWTDHRPDTPEGCRELQTFLEDELRQAQLVHSPSGAQGFVHGDSPQSQAEAEWALIGNQAVWFCAFHYDEAISGRRRKVHKDTLVIKYLVDKRYADDLLTAWPRRSIGKVDLVPFWVGQSLDKGGEPRPSWEELTKAVVTERAVDHQGSQKLLRSYRFMLEYQGVALRARQYPYVLVRSEEGDALVLTQDHERDRRWLHGDPLLTSYAQPRRRPPLGDFARQLLTENEWARVTLVEDRTGRDGHPADPYFGGRAVEARLKVRLDADSVQIQPLNGRQVPERGWLRPDEDRGTEIQLRREARGLDSLAHKPGLVRILDAPEAIELRSRGVTSRDQSELRGKGQAIVSNMLRFHPFYALQGPPGTGKSTVVAKALRDFLEMEHGSRVLVSAQSNDALDQLAEKILKELRPRIEDRSLLALRELSLSQEREEARSPVRQLTAVDIVEDLVTHIVRRVELGCEGARGEDEKRLMKRWADLAGDTRLELIERVKSGADIVFATCSIAGKLSEEVSDPSDMFDWVIIEEAAKAWPTEVVMPLVRGVRWTLVGDYQQLGPHRAQDMQNFLEGLAAHEHDRIQAHFANQDAYLDHLHMFRRFFEGHDPRRTASARRPVDVLVTQFRMHPDIATPFARAFYPDAGPTGTFLTSDPFIDQIHGRTEPPYVTNAPLVWLDTARHDGCRDTPYWGNEGEAELIDDLVARLGLAHRTDPGGLVVITPYRKQAGILEAKGLRGRVHTVHSFQGGEAEVVIVSLVRSAVRGEGTRGNIGHTAQPEVVNVMLSRARQLLVVVGDLAHFEQYGGADWGTVIQAFRDSGVIVDAVTEDITGGRRAVLPPQRDEASEGAAGAMAAEDAGE
ncbi:AAA domain-containing protein [Streptomyces murinus]|uniref:AAA domain-containing protein n=1 Tax=Streptomyces murinus TaxID=33900 RepID=UPI002E7FD696|nr:AAA domain-containing protein [Streptomyces murinus]WUD09906.1 AAA domain-containing protein [Streptomyces murinus]